MAGLHPAVHSLVVEPVRAVMGGPRVGHVPVDRATALRVVGRFPADHIPGDTVTELLAAFAEAGNRVEFRLPAVHIPEDTGTARPVASAAVGNQVEVRRRASPAVAHRKAFDDRACHIPVAWAASPAAVGPAAVAPVAVAPVAVASSFSLS